MLLSFKARGFASKLFTSIFGAESNVETVVTLNPVSSTCNVVGLDPSIEAILYANTITGSVSSLQKILPNASLIIKKIPYCNITLKAKTISSIVIKI
jgi:hypothetical protein